MAEEYLLTLIRSLLREALTSHNKGDGVGSMSSSLYDTAWVASVSRKSGTLETWTFPSSFKYVLDSQKPDGRWFDEPTQAGDILSTLAALYTLIQHAARPLQLGHMQRDTEVQIRRAKDALSADIKRWNVSESREVGFEILIPSMLDVLAREGLHFEFQKRSELYEARDKKLSRVRPEVVYGSRSTLLHSLEAFYGNEKFDFDRVRCHKIDGSIMASPAATAAYLMRSSTWDDDAEAYLRLVLSKGSGNGSGAVPCAYPTTYFEIIWMASTFLSAGVTTQDLGHELVHDLRSSLHRAQSQADGLIGFAPGIQPDLDDSAKGSVILSLLGAPGISKAIVSKFASAEHFKTYATHERNPSFSANANALHAMALESLSDQPYEAEMKTVADFLTRVWFKSDGLPDDKWNISPYYSAMLVAHAFCALLNSWESGKAPGLDETWLQERVLLVLSQCTIRLLATQDSDGSWQSCEETAYVLLALSELSSLPQPDTLARQTTAAFGKGRQYLEDHKTDAKFRDLWVEKVQYTSSNVTQAYIYAARLTTLAKTKYGPTVHNLAISKTSQFAALVERLPLFTTCACPRWLVQASWAESQLFATRLRRQREQVLVRSGMTKDKYLDMIPFAWCAVNNMKQDFLASDFLFDMMWLSLLNYQIDEYMEAVVGARFSHRIDEVRIFIDHIFEDDASKRRKTPFASQNGYANGTANGTNGRRPSGDEATTNGTSTDDRPNGHGATHPRKARKEPYSHDSHDEPRRHKPDAAFDSALQPLQAFVSEILQYQHIQHAHRSDQAQLKQELRTFLHAHCTQIEQSQAFYGTSRQSSRQDSFYSPQYSLKDWVRTVAADHTSCPYSFAFATCLAGASRGDKLRFFSSQRQRYLASDLCRHLATMCRLYNDYGSLARDREEKNLNVADFAELREEAPSLEDSNGEQEASPQSAPSDEELKERIMWMAEYERECMQLARTKLTAEVGADVKRVLDVFIGVTDLFGQVYVVKDIASRRTS